MKNIKSAIAVATLALSIIGATAAPAIASTFPDAPQHISPLCPVHTDIWIAHGGGSISTWTPTLRTR